MGRSGLAFCSVVTLHYRISNCLTYYKMTVSTKLLRSNRRYRMGSLCRLINTHHHLPISNYPVQICPNKKWQKRSGKLCTVASDVPESHPFLPVITSELSVILPKLSATPTTWSHHGHPAKETPSPLLLCSPIPNALLCLEFFSSMNLFPFCMFEPKTFWLPWLPQ